MRLLLLVVVLLVPPSTMAQRVSPRVLVPILIDTPGAFGAHFVTELTVFNPQLYPMTVEGLVRECGMPDCPNAGPIVLAPQETVINFVKNGAPGRVITQGEGGTLEYSLRVRDQSRNEFSNGVQLPVVAESEFRQYQTIVGIDLNPRFRARLRVYSLDASTPSIVLRRAEDGQEVTAWPFPATTIRPPAPGYPAYIEWALPAFEEGRYRVEIRLPDTTQVPTSPLWAMVTLTNNVTQEITTMVPNYHCQPGDSRPGVCISP